MPAPGGLTAGGPPDNLTPMMTNRDRPTGWGEPPLAAPTLEEFRAAAERVRAVAVRTPLLRLDTPGGEDILLKPELLQPTGSFKVRGAYNWAAGLDNDRRLAGFLTFSAGNTALALGYVGRLFKVGCRSIVPDYVPASKVERLRRAGVETVQLSADEMWDWVFRAGWRDERQAFLHPWTEPRMVAGHGTIGLELADDLGDFHSVFVPVGGGALAAGVGSALRALGRQVRVFGVQSASYPALAASLDAGKPVWVEPGPTICEGVGVPFVADAMFPLLRDVVDEVVVVNEDRVRDAIRLLAASAKLVVEGAGALALTGALAVPLARRGRSVVLVTGGSIGAGELARILAPGDSAS